MRWRNLLRAYAWVELAIGLAALIFHPAYLATTEFAYGVAFPALADNWLAQLFKWVSAGLLIFPQAVLLGATFPLISNSLIRRRSGGNGAILSGLYFTNSIGAAFGALFATFVLLPAIGLPGTMRFAAVLNIVVAIVAFLLAARDSSAAPPVEVEPANRRSVPVMTLLLSAALVTGLTSFVYEIGWVRMLSLVLGSTVHAFELMLAAFIGGLAFGGLWIRKRIDAYRQPIRVAGYVQILMGVAALASLVIYDHSFDWVAWFMSALSKSDKGYALFNLVTMSTAIAIMAPAAFFAGMTLPLFTFELIRAGGGEASVGRIYAANTIGAIIGVFAAVHFLVPALGLKLTMVSAAAGDLVLGIVLLRHALEPERVRAYLGALAGCGAALVAGLLLAHFDPAAMAGGVYRDGNARLNKDTHVVYYRDGSTASVASFIVKEGVAAIATNGKVDAAIQLIPGREPTGDEMTMIMLGFVPLAAHPHARTAAVIGFGSGISTHTLLGDPGLERVDTIEIEPAMYEGAKIFGRNVERAYKDPRSHVHFDDAKTYFAAQEMRYDIIVSEPSNPWVSGVATLFSREFYHFIPQHLSHDGVFVQWIQQYEITDELVATVVRALASSFSDFRIYLTNGSDMLILATANGTLSPIDDAIFREPNLQAAMQRAGLISPVDLEVHEIGDRQSLLPLYNALSIRSNSDFYPIISLEAPGARFAQSSSRVLFEMSVADLPMREVLADLAPPNPALVTINSNYKPTQLTHQALAISEALRDGTPLTSVPELDGPVAFARAAVGQCRGIAEGTAEIDTLILLAGRTIPFLGSGRLSGVWSAPRWIDCATQPESVRATLRVLEALGQRDFAVAGSGARTVLETYKEGLSVKARDWFLRAAMLAAIAQHDYGAVRDIDTSLGKDVQPNANTMLHRVYLLAFADARLKEKMGEQAVANPK
jgi:predicted membrane-bound spermidine synthase